MKNLFLVLTMILLIGCQSGEIKTEAIENNPIQGVWKIIQIITETTGNQFANPSPQACIFIFTKNYYSMIWSPNDVKRVDYQERWRPSDREKILSYNSIIANSGTYKTTKGKLETSPQIAKNNTLTGGKVIYDYLVNEKSLTLTLLEVISNDDVKDERIKNYKTTIKLKRVE